MSLKIKVGNVEMTVEEARDVFAGLQQLFGNNVRQEPSPRREAGDLADLRRRVEALERRGAVVGPVIQPQTPWPDKNIRFNEILCGVAAGAADGLSMNSGLIREAS